MLLGIGNFIGRGSGRVSGAAQMLAAYSDGLAIDGRDLSMVIKDTGTPANAFSGNPNSKLTYASPSTKWILGRSGLYESGTTLRTEYNAGGTALGIRTEDLRTNLFLNSRTPSTQSVTTTAQSYTISGVGAVGATLTLSGTATGTLTGTGAADRDKLTVTATAGSLTITVSGTWDFVQVEAGAVASSPIVTTGSTVTRAADVITLATGLFPSGFPLSIGVVGRIGATPAGIWAGMVGVTNGIAAGVHLGWNPSAQGKAVVGATPSADLSANGTFTAGARVRMAAAFAENDVAISLNGAAETTDTSVAMPSGLTRLQLGASYQGSVNPVGVHIEKLIIVPGRLSNAELQGLLA